MTAPDGLLVVDKPLGWTSHDVVARSRRLCQTRKIGHAGTLDPLATGVLVLGVGRGTKLLTYLVGCDKDYTATIRLGESTLTDDAEAPPERIGDPSSITEDDVASAVATLTGDITQVPSAVSAIKVAGQRAYAKVRAGEAVELAGRPVTVSRFAVVERRSATSATGPVLDLDVEVTVSSGTYVRALARDLGAALGVGGHLTALRRTRVGGFGLEAAPAFEELLTAAEAGGIPPVIPLVTAAAAAFPTRALDAAETLDLRHGKRLAPSAGHGAEPVAAVDPDGELVALLTNVEGRARSLVVFPPAGS